MIVNNFKYTLNMKEDIILYESGDGNIKVSLFARNGSVWLNQSQLAELFATSKQSISSTINNILKDNELDINSVVKDFLTRRSIKFSQARNLHNWLCDNLVAQLFFICY